MLAGHAPSRAAAIQKGISNSELERKRVVCNRHYSTDVSSLTLSVFCSSFFLSSSSMYGTLGFSFAVSLICLNVRAPRVHRSVVSSAEPDKRTVEEGEQPQQHVDKIDPNSVLHPNLPALMRGWVCWNVDFAEGAE